MSKHIYSLRRQALAKQLPKNSLILIPAAFESLRNGDTHYPFRQASDFYYLTGFNEPQAVLIITAEADNILFLQERNPSIEQWTGERLGVERACAELKVNSAYSITEFDRILPDILANRSIVHYPRGASIEKNLLMSWEKVKQQKRRGFQIPENFCDSATILGEMRLFKDEVELKNMRTAAEISIEAHKKIAQACLTANYEYNLEAEFLYEITRLGCRNVAYSPIIASGANACVLHYTANNAEIKPNDIILVDAGAEYDGYAADITRVLPASGRFNTEQRAIYECVYQAQQAALALAKPGCRWNKLQAKIVQIITQGLIDLKILSGNLDSLIQQEAYKPFYMHQSGHWLGLDVHDVGSYYTQNGEFRSLEVGMCLTVEPGIYISPHLDVEPRWHGIGVRIEDDIAITKHGYELLSSGFSANIDDIEAYLCD